MKLYKLFLLLVAFAFVGFILGIVSDRAFLSYEKSKVIPHTDSIDYYKEIQDAISGGRIPGDDTVAGIKIDTLYLAYQVFVPTIPAHIDSINNWPKKHW